MTSVLPSDDQDYRYAAFLSYRHVEPDRRWTLWLHTSLETYRIPRRLVRERGITPRVGRVFRDEEELDAAPDLSAEIRAALQQSRFLIVVCSPRTPASPWVDKEVSYFRELGRGDRILALLIEGEPRDSFPRSLREIRHALVDAEDRLRSEITEVEPLAADVRPSCEGGLRSVRRMAKLRLIARLIGSRFDDLRRRERERQLRRVVGLGSVLVGLSLLVAGLATFALQQQGLKKQFEMRASTNKAEALTNDLLKRREIYTTDQREAFLAWARNRPAEVRALLDKYDPRRNTLTNDLRGFEWYYLDRLLARTFRSLDFGGQVRAVRFAPDGRRIAAVGTVRGAHCVQLWKLPNGEHERNFSLGRAGPVQLDVIKPLTELTGDQGVAYSSDGKFIAGTCLIGRLDRREGVVKVWEADTGREVFSKTDAALAGMAVEFSPDSKYLLAGGYNNAVLVWSLDGALQWTLPAYDDRPNLIGANAAVIPRPDLFGKVQGMLKTTPVNFLGFSRSFLDNQLMLTRTSGRLAQTAWPPAEAGRPMLLAEREAYRSEILGYEILAVAPNDRWFVPRDASPSAIRILDLSVIHAGTANSSSNLRMATSEATTVSLERGPIRCLAFSNTALALAGNDGLVTLGEIGSNDRSWQLRFLLRGHVGDVSCLAFSQQSGPAFGRKGGLLAAAGGGSVTVWDITYPQEQQPFHEAQAEAASQTSTRRWSAPYGPEQNGRNRSPEAFIKIRDVDHTDVPPIHFKSPGESVAKVVFSPDGSRCAITTYAPAWLTMPEWAFRPVLPKAIPKKEAKAKTEAIKRYEAPIYIVELPRAETVRVLKGHHTNHVPSISFHPDGRRLVSASGDGTIRLWDASDGRELRRIDGLPTSVGRIEFSPDGRWIIGASAKNRISLWSPDLSKTVRSFESDDNAHWTLRPDSRQLAFLGTDGQIRIWDLEHDRLIRNFSAGGRKLKAIAFDVHGSRLITFGDDVLTIWSIESGEDVFSLPNPELTFSSENNQHFVNWLASLEDRWKSETKVEPPTHNGLPSPSQPGADLSPASRAGRNRAGPSPAALSKASKPDQPQPDWETRTGPDIPTKSMPATSKLAGEEELDALESEVGNLSFPVDRAKRNLKQAALRELRAARDSIKKGKPSADAQEHLSRMQEALKALGKRVDETLKKNAAKTKGETIGVKNKVSLERAERQLDKVMETLKQ